MNSSYDEIKNEEADLSGSVVEEKIIKIDGEIEIRKYYVGYQKLGEAFSGHYYPFKYYEFKSSENNKIFAAKVPRLIRPKEKRWSFRSKCGKKWHFGTKYPLFRDEKRII